MSDEEDDYMSDAFLNQIPEVRPGVPMVKRVKDAIKKEAMIKEKNQQNRQKTFKEQERESRDTVLQSSISNENKGFALLQKMGYKAGQGLGKQGAGRVEPIPLNIKNRGGIGMEEAKKRKAEEELRHYRHKVRVQQQTEKQSLEDFRVRKRTEREERQTESDLRRSQRACEQLDNQKGITTPRDCWYWPEKEKEAEEDEEDDEEDKEEKDDEEEAEEEEEEGLTALDKLQFLTSYLRDVHFYCIWCGTTYNDEEDLNSNCPGDTAADHDD